MPVQNPFGGFTVVANNNIAQWDGVNLGTPSAWGTPATGQVVIGVNADSFIAELAATTGTLTTQSGAGSTVTVSTTGMGVASVVLSGTYGAGTVVAFQYTQDGSVWTTAYGTSGGAPVQTSIVTLTANQTVEYDFGVYGTTQFRAVCTTYVSGTVNVNIILSAANIEPSPTVAAIVTDSIGNEIGSTSEGSPATTGLNVHVQNSSPIAVSGTVSVNVSGTVPAIDYGTYAGMAYPINMDGSSYLANQLVSDPKTQGILSDIQANQEQDVDQWYDGAYAVQIQAGTAPLGSTYVPGLAGNALNTVVVGGNVRVADGAGNPIGSEFLAPTYWLNVNTQSSQFPGSPVPPQIEVGGGVYGGAAYPANLDGSTVYSSQLVSDRQAEDLLNQIRDDIEADIDQWYDGAYAVQIVAGDAPLGSSAVPGRGGNALNTSAMPSGNPLVTGQQAVLATAAALPSNFLTRGISVEAKSTNTATIFVGGPGVTTATGLELPAGAAVTLQVANSNVVYVIAVATGQTVTWLGY